jgi:hypothetical protein
MAMKRRAALLLALVLSGAGLACRGGQCEPCRKGYEPTGPSDPRAFDNGCDPGLNCYNGYCAKPGTKFCTVYR